MTAREQAAEVDLNLWRERAGFWSTRDPSTIGHLYDEAAVMFAGEVTYLLDRLERAEAAVARAEALRNLPLSLVEYVRASERKGVDIARDAQITTKHLSRMLNHYVGSLDAWVRVIHASYADQPAECEEDVDDYTMCVCGKPMADHADQPAEGGGGA